MKHGMGSWFLDEFRREFNELSEAAQDATLVKVGLPSKFGPGLKCPHADTLNGSRYAIMKEPSYDADDGVWRIAFAFDPDRQVILLTTGTRAGANDGRFHRKLIARADERFDRRRAANEGRR